MITDKDLAALIAASKVEIDSTTITFSDWINKIRTNKNYNYKGTAWWRGLVTLMQDKTLADRMFDAAIRELVIVQPPDPPDPPPVTGVVNGISLGSKIMSYSATDQDWVLDQCVAVGATGVRIDRYDAAACDPVIQKALGRKLEVMIVVPGQLNAPVGTENARAYATDAVSRWKGQVRFYEFSNEPDLNGWTPEQYADATTGFVEGVLAADPDATPIFGALWKWKCGGTPDVNDTYGWVDKMLTRWDTAHNGWRPRKAWLSFHGYGTDAWQSDANIWRMVYGPYSRNPKGIRGLLDSRGCAHVGICSTENGDNTSAQSQVDAVKFDFTANGKYGLAGQYVYTMVDDGLSGAFGLYLAVRGAKRPAYQTFYDSAHATAANEAFALAAQVASPLDRFPTHIQIYGPDRFVA